LKKNLIPISYIYQLYVPTLESHFYDLLGSTGQRVAIRGRYNFFGERSTISLNRGLWQTNVYGLAR